MPMVLTVLQQHLTISGTMPFYIVTEVTAKGATGTLVWYEMKLEANT